MLGVIFDTTEASSSVRTKTTNSAGKSSKVSQQYMMEQNKQQREGNSDRQSIVL